METPSWSLRKKLLGFEVGMSYYSGFEKDEEDIIIPFALSLYITSNKIMEQLPVYLEYLKRNECPEVLGVDLDAMTSEAYWMKNYKLEHDMEAMDGMTLKERGIEFAYKGFKPKTTLELYHAIRQNVEQMVAMLKEVRRLLMEGPKELYRNFYHSQRDGFDTQSTVARYEQWKREVGVVTPDLLIDKQALEVVEFLKKKVLRHIPVPSERERCQVDFEKLQLHLPHGYELSQELLDCCARFMRIASKDGDILRINYDCYGKYLHQFFHRLTANEHQSLFDLDITLQLIHQDMAEMKPNETSLLPEALATPEAMILWQKVQQAGYVDEHYQPLISRTQAALLADAIAERLGIREKWKIFEALWHRKNMYRDYYEALNQKKSLKFQDELKMLFF